MQSCGWKRGKDQERLGWCRLSPQHSRGRCMAAPPHLDDGPVLVPQLGEEHQPPIVAEGMQLPRQGPVGVVRVRQPVLCREER